MGKTEQHRGPRASVNPATFKEPEPGRGFRGLPTPEAAMMSRVSALLDVKGSWVALEASGSPGLQQQVCAPSCPPAPSPLAYSSQTAMLTRELKAVWSSWRSGRLVVLCPSNAFADETAVWGGTSTEPVTLLFRSFTKNNHFQLCCLFWQK